MRDGQIKYTDLIVEVVCGHVTLAQLYEVQQLAKLGKDEQELEDKLVGLGYELELAENEDEKEKIINEREEIRRELERVQGNLENEFYGFRCKTLFEFGDNKFKLHKRGLHISDNAKEMLIEDIKAICKDAELSFEMIHSYDYSSPLTFMRDLQETVEKIKKEIK